MSQTLFLIIVIISLFLISFLFAYLLLIKRRFNLFFSKGGEEEISNLEKLLKTYLEKLKEHDKEIKKIFNDIDYLNTISQKSFQKFGIVRYNPFKEAGGDQSFSIVLLDFENNGICLTSLYSRDGNRVYAKPIISGQSKYPLSEEEKEVLKKAIG